MGIFYPDSNETFDSFHDCPSFWRDKKIKINPMNFTSEEYMNNIQISAYVGMALNVAVVVAYFISFKKIIQEQTGRDRLKFFAKIGYAFFLPLVDSITGDLVVKYAFVVFKNHYLDALYFGELESENILVHVDPSVVKAMCAFVFIAVLKDILVGLYIHLLYAGKVLSQLRTKSLTTRQYGLQSTATFDTKDLFLSKMIDLFKDSASPSNSSKSHYKAGESLTSFYLEDFAQVGLQYFYFEKYRFRGSALSAFTQIFMELKRLGYSSSFLVFYDYFRTLNAAFLSKSVA